MLPLVQDAPVFAELREAVESSGLMEQRSSPYVISGAIILLAFLSAVIFVQQGWVVASALTVALFWQQTAFLGHDLGHNAVTQSKRLDGLLGMLVNAGVGIGFSWWKSTHNVHHMVVNAADSDPDIQVRSPLLSTGPPTTRG